MKNSNTPLLIFGIAVAAVVVFAGCVSVPTSDGADAPSVDMAADEGREEEERVKTSSRSSNATQGSGTSANSTAGPGNSGNTTPGDPASPRQPMYDPGWPDLEEALIRPGVGILASTGSTGQGGTHRCTSNFVFHSLDNRSLYLGTAAHCVDDRAINDTVEIAQGAATGTLVYSSYETMNATTHNADNDLALVRVHDEDRNLVHPALLHYGGPTALADSSTVQPGDRVHTFGNSSLRPGEALDPRDGIVNKDWTSMSVNASRSPPAQFHPGWRFTAYILPHSIPGDSGSPVLNATGEALGVLRGIDYIDGSNVVSKLDLMIDYANRHTGLDVELVTWPLLDQGEAPDGPTTASPVSATSVE